MAIITDFLAEKQRAVQQIKDNGATDNSRTKGVNHRAMHLNVLDTLESLMPYPLPDVTALSNAAIIKAFEVGETMTSGPHSIAFSVSNFANVKAQPPNGGTPATNIAGATFPTNPVLLAGSGSFDIVIPSGFKLTAPGQRTISLAGVNTRNAAFDGQVILPWEYYEFFGVVAAVPTTSDAIRNLPQKQFAGNGDGSYETHTIILNTGAGLTNFCVWLPAELQITQVLDLDSSSANITTPYVSTLTVFAVATADGTLKTGKRYCMQAGVPYTLNHRHQITISPV